MATFEIVLGVHRKGFQRFHSNGKKEARSSDGAAIRGGLVRPPGRGCRTGKDRLEIRIGSVVDRSRLRCRRGCGGNWSGVISGLLQRAMTGVEAPAEITPWSRIAR